MSNRKKPTGNVVPACTYHPHRPATTGLKLESGLIIHVCATCRAVILGPKAADAD